MPKPHSLFEVWRADEVAECLDGVGDDLYVTLWAKIVPMQKPIPNIEDNGPADVVGIGCLAQYWHMLSEDEQNALNILAAAYDKTMNRVLGEP